LAAGRLAPADEDCRKAIRLAGNTSEAAQLRSAIDHASATERDQLGRREHAAAAARRLVEQGQLTLGQQVAVRALGNGDERADLLLADINGRRASFERCIADATAAIESQDWEPAIQHLGRAKSLKPGAGEVHGLSKKVGQQVADEAQQLVDVGRLDAAESLLRRVAPLCSSHAELEQIQRGIAQCRTAFEYVRSARHGEAREVLSRLSLAWPRASWLASAIAELAQAGEAMEAVRSGPLGLLDLDQTLAMPNPRPLHLREDRAIARPQIPAPAGPTKRRFLLHVDGAGSYLVLQGGSVDIGPLSASRPPDVPLLTAATSPVITLSRSDEDYFLNARATVTVNERPVTSKLLVGGDRIGVGSRCRIEFRKPNPASASAVLNISGARLPWGGVRQVLLMDRELVVGPSASAHVRTRDGAEQVVLQVSEGQLACRASEAITVDGKHAGKIAKLDPGARVVVGALSFVIQAE
jgi:hypothetical protein